MNAVFETIVATGLVIGLVAAVLIWRARKPLKLSLPCYKKATALPEVPLSPSPRGFARLLAAIDYLRTKREWRYKTPWVMLVGHASSGKTSLLASAAINHTHTTPRQSHEIAVKGTVWQFFDQGVLIDPDGKISAGLPGTAETKDWTRILREIEALRPERAIDALLLTISARTLLHAPLDERQAMAEQTYRQLSDIQARFEFVLPVYVVVTECDAITGFDAFWEAQPAILRKEILGWSTSGPLSSATAEDWTNNTFDTIAEQLKKLHLDAAATHDEISNPDYFFLFPRHFLQLRAPVKQWLNAVFQPSAWRADFLCRGIYFTGCITAGGTRSDGVRTDIAFVEDLITQKVLAEPHLAYPTRQGVWSRNSLIRNLQIAGVAALCALMISLVFAGVQLRQQVNALITSLNMLQEIPASPAKGEVCIGQDRVYPLLAEVARIDANSIYWAIPVSWVDVRASRKSARLIAEAAFQRVVMPSLACQLEKRARQLMVSSPLAEDADKRGAEAYTQSKQALFTLMQSVQTLESNTARFRQIASHAPVSQRAKQLQEFTALATYAYGVPVPKSVIDERGALSSALTQIQYREELHLPPQMRQRFTDQIVPLAVKLRAELGYEISVGSRLLTYLNKEQEPILENTRHFSSWLNWMQESWLGSTSQANPCEQIRTQLDTGLRPLVQHYGYPVALESASIHFSNEQCYRPSMNALKSLQMAPHGPLFIQKNDGLALNPSLSSELSGLPGLVQLGFMQATGTQPFVCQSAASGWRATEVGQATNYMREYADFASRQGLPPLGTATTQRPLFDRLARRQLERAVNSTMRDAQSPDTSSPPLQQVSLQATSLADQQLARDAASFGRSLDPLIGVLRMYGQNRFDASKAKITQCVRDYAADSLAHIDALVSISRLYDPDIGAGSGPFFNLGTTPVTIDYLARQITRTQVLAGYAAPFVTFLQNTDAVSEAQRANSQTAPYWNNTITELNRYAQFKETAGQVAQLHNLFLKEFVNLDNATCGKTLSAYQAPAYGNDLFSQRREHLEEQVQWRCTDSKKAQAYEAYRELSDRFNRELAGRYPFADSSARDASPAVVKTFFNDYQLQRPVLKQALSGLQGNRWNTARRFLDQLDAISAFFNPNLTAGDQSQPLSLSILFRAQPASSPGSEQVVSWALSSGAKSAGYPNRATALDWPFGEALVLDLTWADRSLWRPMDDPMQSSLQIDGTSASFTAFGEWALLRFMEMHRPKTGNATDAIDPYRTLLEFTVPVVSNENPPGKVPTSTARLYIALKLTGKDPKTQVPVNLTLPAAFPRFAPQ